MPITRSGVKKVYKQPTRKAANKAKYQDNENINTIISVIGNPIEDRPNATAGSVRVPRELLSNLSGHGSNAKAIFDHTKFNGDKATFTTYIT